jgi:hypothetical protein
MSAPRALPEIARRVLPWLAAWIGLQVLVGTVGRLLARRLDQGDETTAAIRRVVALRGVELAPRNPELSRVRFDLVMGGAQLDLSGLDRVPGGIDLTVRAVMGGVSVRVPAGWRVAWAAGGPGGVGIARGAPVTRVDDPPAADLRVHARLVFGGVGIEAPAA